MTNNREIKFRGFHIDENGKEKVYVNGGWVKGYWVIGTFYPNGKWLPVFEIYKKYPYIGNDEILREVIPETVGQYTGLKDKNGNEIYKGDIVEFFGMKGRIVKECGAFGIGTSRQINYDKLETKMPYGNSPAFCYNDNFISLWELWWNYEQDDNPLYEVEVIGNIYENPELLEVK